MASAAWALQKAIHETLSADAAVTALLGGARVYDDVPRGAEFPYVTFGPAAARDWSTGSEAGSEHAVVLHVWSRHAGKGEAHLILEAVRAALAAADLSLEGHRLINLTHEASEAAREADGETYRGVARFRAVVEPA
jgi:hypothetical protein